MHAKQRPKLTTATARTSRVGESLMNAYMLIDRLFEAANLRGMVVTFTVSIGHRLIRRDYSIYLSKVCWYLTNLYCVHVVLTGFEF
jgi:hypothetical protein